MLPTPLAPPLPVRPTRRTRRRGIPWLTLAGLLLLVAAVAGALVWAAALSPYGFVRFSLPRVDRMVTVSRPGAYLVFEEDAGAARGDLPPRLEITVLDERGRTVPVEALIDPGEKGAPFGYHVPPHEGRAIARFDAPRVGRYLLQVEPLASGSFEPSEYSDELPDGLAVGRQLAMPWLRTPLGLLVLGVVPLAAGVGLLVLARRRRRSARAAGGPSETVR